MNPIPVSIDIVSDIVCPWCYLGKLRLEKALSGLPEIAATVRWHPFQLDPTIPRGGISRHEYLTKKFGRDLSRIDASHAHITAAAAEFGAVYNFDRITRSPNTLDAHRVVRWATGPKQDAVMTQLFQLNFTGAADVGRPEVLAEAGELAGLPAADTLRRLATDEDTAAVQSEIANWQRMGVTGVPCFVLGGRYAVMGAQSPEVLADAIRKVAAGPVAARA